MNRAIIIGTYEFLGFHFCLYLLEQGIEVIGIHLHTIDQDPFLEEKRMEIGRNDNFAEKNIDYLLSLDWFLENTFIFIDHYSYYFKQADKDLMSVVNKAFINHYPDQIVFLLPIQLYIEAVDENFNTGIEVFPDIHHDAVYSAFYLPTLYGPWQPVEYAFQHSLIYPDIPVIVNEREWMEDALYIDDVVEKIMHSLMDRGNKSYILRSKIKDQWQRIASMFLHQSSIATSKPLTIVSKDVIVLDVGDTDLIDGFEEQKKHLMRFRERRH